MDTRSGIACQFNFVPSSQSISSSVVLQTSVPEGLSLSLRSHCAEEDPPNECSTLSAGSIVSNYQIYVIIHVMYLVHIYMSPFYCKEGILDLVIKISIMFTIV